MVWIATQTLDLLNRAVISDGGNTYRRNLGIVMPMMTDAYRDDEDDHRKHLGASVVGDECERAVWLKWRWALKRPPGGYKGEDPNTAHARMIRLWNRGHMEEGRFLAMLLTAGMEVWQQDAEGKQFRISEFGGHFSGSCDGIVRGIPELPGIPALSEYKTHKDDSFSKLIKDGVRRSKPMHYVQMMLYMRRLGLVYGIYFAVNKDDDRVYAEILQYDGAIDETFTARAGRLIFSNKFPPRMRSASPGFFKCKLCDVADVCYNAVPMDRNCRTCKHIAFHPDGTTRCENPEEISRAEMQGWDEPIELNKEQQIEGCGSYEVMPRD